MKKVLVLMTFIGGTAMATTLPIDMAQNINTPPPQQKVQVEVKNALDKARIAATVGFSPCGRNIKDAEQALGGAEIKLLNRTFCLNVATKSLADMAKVRNVLKVPVGQDVFAREGFIVRLTLR